MYKNVYGYISPLLLLSSNLKMSLAFFAIFFNKHHIYFYFSQMWITSIYNTEER